MVGQHDSLVVDFSGDVTDRGVVRAEAVIFPFVRGIPLLDLWLRENTAIGDKVSLPDARLGAAPGLPNRFLAVVPWGSLGIAARELAERCENAARLGWRALATDVRGKLHRILASICVDWDKRWDDQVEGFFEIRTATLPLRDSGEQVLAALWGKPTFAEAFPEAANVRRLADAIPDDECPHYLQQSNPDRTNSSGLWQCRSSCRRGSWKRSGPFVMYPRQPRPGGHVPPKCSLMGSYEQMGPDGLEQSAKFWEVAVERFRREPIAGIRMRTRERVAVALVKRFAEVHLAKELGLAEDDRRIPDTATIAARKWRADAEKLGISFELESGQWLHWPARDFDEDEPCIPQTTWERIQAARNNKELGPPPAYYAVLAMDGDNMGGWLRGENSPLVGEVLHPDLREYFAPLSMALGHWPRALAGGTSASCCHKRGPD